MRELIEEAFNDEIGELARRLQADDFHSPMSWHNAVYPIVEHVLDRLAFWNESASYDEVERIVIQLIGVASIP